MRTGLDNRKNRMEGPAAAGAATIYREDLRNNRRKYLIALLILLAIFFAYLCFRSTKISFLSPWQTVSNLYTAAKLQLAQIFHWQVYNDRLAIIKAHPAYEETLTRLSGGVTAIALGAAMSVSGAVFQCVFRNPIAVPTMLGVSSGINIANLVLVLQYNLLAVTLTTQRFIYGYIFSLAILFLVMGISKLTSRDGSWAIVDVLLVGTVLTRILTQILNSLESTYMDDTAYQTVQEMNTYGAGIGNSRGWIFLALALLTGLVPILLMRNSLNVVTFTEEESKVMGLNATVMRILALVFSTILIIAAEIYMGDVGMLALLVPHICRYLFGSDTKNLIYSSIIVGGIVMLICRFVVSLMMFNQYLSVISIGMIINVISVPLMCFILFTDRRGWE